MAPDNGIGWQILAQSDSELGLACAQYGDIFPDVYIDAINGLAFRRELCEDTNPDTRHNRLVSSNEWLIINNYDQCEKDGEKKERKKKQYQKLGETRLMNRTTQNTHTMHTEQLAMSFRLFDSMALCPSRCYLPFAENTIMRTKHNSLGRILGDCSLQNPFSQSVAHNKLDSLCDRYDTKTATITRDCKQCISVFGISAAIAKFMECYFRCDSVGFAGGGMWHTPLHSAARIQRLPTNDAKWNQIQ